MFIDGSGVANTTLLDIELSDNMLVFDLSGEQENKVFVVPIEFIESIDIISNRTKCLYKYCAAIEISNELFQLVNVRANSLKEAYSHSMIYAKVNNYLVKKVVPK